MWARSSAFRGAAAFGHIEPDGYPKAAEAGEPELLCLSRANDDDYEAQLENLENLEPAAFAARRSRGGDAGHCKQCESGSKKARIAF